jgi:acyl carrier protein
VDRASVTRSVGRNGGTPLRSSGIAPNAFLDVETGAALLETFLTDDLGPQVIVAPEGLREKLRRSDDFTAAAVRSSGGPASGQQAAPRAAEPAAPATAEDGLTARVTGLWTEILGTEAGSDDDFFESGGDSLAAVQLIDRIRGELGVALPISTLFDHPTLGELVAAVRERG